MDDDDLCDVCVVIILRRARVCVWDVIALAR